MRIVHGLRAPEKHGRERYDFDALKHGDAFEIEPSKIDSAREVFRRWRKRTGRRAQLVRSTTRGQENLLFFIDEKVTAHADVI
jgi:hypothetical protein